MEVIYFRRRRCGCAAGFALPVIRRNGELEDEKQ
jgi:hypothetical protein